MRSLFSLTLVVLSLATVQSAEPRGLALMPKQLDFLLAIEQPTKLVNLVRQHPLLPEAMKLPQIQQIYQSTNTKQFFQLLELVEKATGQSWPSLVDSLGGAGIYLGVQTSEPEPAPVLLLLHGRDTERTGKLYQTLLRLLEEQLAQQDGAGAAVPKVVRRSVGSVETAQIGPDLVLARLGSTLRLSNQKKLLEASLQLEISGKAKGSLADRTEPRQARELLGGEPLAWFWYDFAKQQQRQETKDFFAATRKDFLQTVVLGSSIDAFRRSNLLAVGLEQEGAGLRVRLRLPAKRAGLPPEFSLHAPLSGQVGSLPLLEPKNILYSQSFYLDLAALWKNRQQLYNDQILGDIEEGEKAISRILPGVSISKLLESSGPYHRLVAVSTDYGSYKTKPDQPLPAFALVSRFRDPEFAKTVPTALRAAGFIASLQLGLRLEESDVNGIKVVSYRFAENKPLAGDETNLRYNFVPSFAIVGEDLILSSQPKLIPELVQEQLRKRKPEESSQAVWRAKLYGTGAKELQQLVPESSLSQLVLSQGITLPEARKQLAQLGQFLEKLGTADVELDHAEQWFQIQATWRPK